MRGPIARAADGRSLSWWASTVGPLAGSTVELSASRTGNRTPRSPMIPAGSGCRVAVAPGDYQIRLRTESCDSNGRTYTFESYGGRTEVGVRAMRRPCIAGLRSRESRTPPGISGFVAGPAAGVTITVRTIPVVWSGGGD